MALSMQKSGIALRGAVRPSSSRRSVVVRAEGVPDTAKITCRQVKQLVNDKGYEFWDIRTPDENAEGAKRWWKNVPFAFMGEKGPVLNRQFKPFLLRALPNKMSRVILACDDGTDRSEMAFEMAQEEGYTAIKVLEGGCLAYLEFDPLDEKDKAPKWRLTGQTSGVRYAYSDGATDDSA
uniref:Rhodanese domain-containing protein n=1 Tax=Dunaliella tertiolecta TaxID=3047 RepID=A0A7S3QKM4_DUNTE|mmetsp:Transcript_23508/g.64818  ORF Transcript_23508/g.64818 Transcript_23508/m.64818 type:complete len:179 (+) Transcript_23508:35-571(+)|eukprot:CAMPEP_0202341154 /NCGR_PEP_ID=MMETSP1126-20121109/2281_1 /ASSEMBLY_ACC=CAM_ASM_000457 /TAXON_ID=3047 /ORGANISM="Dunaliella tertiolecta, Strain CCMP1320" /LENGTH=178 /DNA_ID=CAMNT_0048931951 /DNA_START=38 /DNA_END=574 /DNA_ORIENTATION=-